MGYIEVARFGRAAGRDDGHAGADSASYTWTPASRARARVRRAGEIDVDKQWFLDELGQIKGIGPVLIARHGAAVLVLVAAHA